jgi:hypothetical protein
MIEPIFAITPKLPADILIGEDANVARGHFQPLNLGVPPGARILGSLVLFPAHDLVSEGEEPLAPLMQVNVEVIVPDLEDKVLSMRSELRGD